MNRVNKFYQDILEAIDFESAKDLSQEWTEEYRQGFVDGLKRSVEIMNDANVYHRN